MDSPSAFFPLEALEPFQASPPQVIFVTTQASDLVANPTTEVAILPLRENLTQDEIAAASNESAVFGAALLDAPAPVAYTGNMALTYKSSWAAGTPKNRLVMIIGWREVQNHLDAMKSAVFQDNLKPISDKIGGDMDVKHFQWKYVE